MLNFPSSPSSLFFCVLCISSGVGLSLFVWRFFQQSCLFTAELEACAFTILIIEKKNTYRFCVTVRFIIFMTFIYTEIHVISESGTKQTGNVEFVEKQCSNCINPWGNQFQSEVELVHCETEESRELIFVLGNNLLDNVCVACTQRSMWVAMIYLNYPPIRKLFL